MSILKDLFSKIGIFTEVKKSTSEFEIKEIKIQKKNSKQVPPTKPTVKAAQSVKSDFDISKLTQKEAEFLGTITGLYKRGYTKKEIIESFNKLYMKNTNYNGISKDKAEKIISYFFNRK